MPAKAFFLLLSAAFLLIWRPSEAAEFSQPDWDNPGLSGSSLWIRNGRPRQVSLTAFFVRCNSFQTYGEVAFNAGSRRHYFTVAGSRPGQWCRLVPKSPGRIRIKARDSLMLSRFECGQGLAPVKRAGHSRKAAPPRKAAEEYVLDLKTIDNWGDTAVVKLFQLEPRYEIVGNPGMASSEAPGERGAPAGWGTLDVTQGGLKVP